MARRRPGCSRVQAAEPGRQVPETLKVLVVPEPAESLRSWCLCAVSGTLLTHVLGTVPKCGNPWILWIWFLPTVFCRVSVAAPRSSAYVGTCILGAKVQAPGSTCPNPGAQMGHPGTLGRVRSHRSCTAGVFK